MRLSSPILIPIPIPTSRPYISPSLSRGPEFQSPPLHHCFVVRQVLVDLGSNISLADFGGNRPAHTAARGGHVGVLRLLKSLGANMAVLDGDLRSPLFKAAYKGHAEATSELAKMGAALDSRDALGYTAFLAAAHTGHKRVIVELAQLGAQVRGRRRGHCRSTLCPREVGSGFAYMLHVHGSADYSDGDGEMHSSCTKRHVCGPDARALWVTLCNDRVERTTLLAWLPALSCKRSCPYTCMISANLEPPDIMEIDQAIGTTTR